MSLAISADGLYNLSKSSTVDSMVYCLGIGIGSGSGNILPTLSSKFVYHHRLQSSLLRFAPLGFEPHSILSQYCPIQHALVKLPLTICYLLLHLPFVTTLYRSSG
jgi:hypothetical protein